MAIFANAAVAPEKPLPDRQGLSAVGGLLLIAVLLTALDRSGWATLFIFTAVAIASVVRSPFSFYGVLLCTALCACSVLAVGGQVGEAIAYSTPTLGIGMLMLVVADLRTRNRELHEARAELAQLAVADERARFARDLHDLLGHSLSVIALKAELAGRLLREQPAEAAGHVSEIEQVARGALTEVREAVSGYRQPTLDDEIAGAKMALFGSRDRGGDRAPGGDVRSGDRGGAGMDRARGRDQCHPPQRRRALLGEGNGRAGRGRG